MDASDETTAKGVTALEEEEPSGSQLTKNRGRSNSPPWRKSLVYDCEQETVQVTSEKNIGQQRTPGIHAQSLTEALQSDDHWPKIHLSPKDKQVTIFVDPQTESKPTTESRGADGRSNVVLATLNLSRLGAYCQVLRFLGLLSTLYVANAAPWSETSSQIIGGQKPGNTGE